MSDILQLSPKELKKYLQDNCYISIPVSIETPEDMVKASQLLGKINAYRTYLMGLVVDTELDLKAVKQESDKAKEEYEILSKMEKLAHPELKEIAYNKKEKYECLSDKKKVCVYMESVLDNQYSTLSRLITIKIEANKELSRVNGY